MKWCRASVDTGGTFTDCLVEWEDGRIDRGKVLSSGRIRIQLGMAKGDGWYAATGQGLDDACLLKGKALYLQGTRVDVVEDCRADAIRVRTGNGLLKGQILEIESGLEAPLLALRQLTKGAGSVDGADFRLGTTKGTNALLEGKGGRVALFVTKGFADLLQIGDQTREDLFALDTRRPAPLPHFIKGVEGRVSREGTLSQPLDKAGLCEAASEALAEGCTVAAVCLVNSWSNPEQELEAGRLLEACGFGNVCLSSAVSPKIHYLNRMHTVVADALLKPVMDDYLDAVESGLTGARLQIMTSSGGLLGRDRFHSVDSLLSGPAGGVAGAVQVARKSGMEKMLSFDMGGTSTDVSRWDGRLPLSEWVEVGSVKVVRPALKIETVAAGGGSICSWSAGALQVGPESAGAVPGPAAYGNGGPLTLTDIHLLLGRIDACSFGVPLDLKAAEKRLDEVLTAAGLDASAGEVRDQVAEGFLQIATERMAQAIRKVSVREGEDPSEYSLVVYGGAGGLQACRLADELGIGQILYPLDAGILSASGIHASGVEAVEELELQRDLGEVRQQLEDHFKALRQSAKAALLHEGVAAAYHSSPEMSVLLRRKGQEFSLTLDWEDGCNLEERFTGECERIFGYIPETGNLEVASIRLRMGQVPAEDKEETFAGTTLCSFEQRGEDDRRFPIVERHSLNCGDAFSGPALLNDPFGTFVVEGGWKAVVGSEGGLRFQREEKPADGDGSTSSGVSQVAAALTSNRLAAVVGEMGEQLRRTALSTNIRERLDFSCALLDAEGQLVLNAPHIPVHLGAMGLCLREILRKFSFGPGDCLVTNHPGAGGSHLPDVTLIQGIFAGEGECLGYLANRAHHAEIGGRTPGSMPTEARSLAEEGVVIEPQWVRRKGQTDFAGVTRLLQSAPWPSRSPEVNLQDLEAQLASLERGQVMMKSLLQREGSSRLKDHLRALQEASEGALAQALRTRHPISVEGSAELDNGALICCQLEFSESEQRIDFSGTSTVQGDNLNATPAIVRSALLYVFRLLCGGELPLNEGLLNRIHLILPECFLNPAFPEEAGACPAVVGGNVETSQQLVDLLVRMTRLQAGGQATMNNLLFGNAYFGYYETIGGGGGAGPGFDGADGLHVHMTNTAITDAEVLEHRFPVICRQFALRQGSGGAGRWRGGNGLVRELVFTEAVTVSLLAQRRESGAPGMDGGETGQPGRQFRIAKDGSRFPLPGSCRVELEAGEGICMETPGGGGWGLP
jgi:5-oxoprolinase (ATP-hydrolysing)